MRPEMAPSQPRIWFVTFAQLAAGSDVGIDFAHCLADGVQRGAFGAWPVRRANFRGFGQANEANCVRPM